MSTKLQTQQLAELRLILDEYEPGCDCGWPDEAESGIIYCLACAIRDRLGLGATKEHKNNARLTEEDA